MNNFNVFRLQEQLNPHLEYFCRVLKLLITKNPNFNLALRYILLLIINRHFLKSLFPRLKVFLNFLADQPGKWVIQSSTAIVCFLVLNHDVVLIS